MGPPKKNTSFRFSSKYCYLTYPQCPIPREDALHHLLTVLGPYDPKFVAVSQEFHEDGNPHLHVLIQCFKRINTSRAAVFDIPPYHPNIQNARDSKAVLEYISKEGQPLIWGVYQSHKVSPKKKDSTWLDIITTSTTKQDYLQRVQTHFPGDWATKLKWIEYSADKLFPPEPKLYVSPFPETSLTCHENIDRWLNTELYLVSAEVYAWYANILLYDAVWDLTEMARRTRRQLDGEDSPSSSSDRPGQGRPPGQDPSGDTTTSTGALTGSNGTIRPSTPS